MPDVYIIMGTRNTRKSSTVRALTGVVECGCYEVATTNGNIESFIQIRAVQEAEINPKDFIQTITNGKHENVLLALRIFEIKIRGKIFPAGDVYLHKFASAGWKIKDLIVLGTDALPFKLPVHLPQPFYVSDSTEKPSNKIASQLRQRWGWL